MSASRKKAEQDMLAQREFKAYVSEVKERLKAQYISQQEIPVRFYEICNKMVEDHGSTLVMNLDLLRDTKQDPKVGALIL